MAETNDNTYPGYPHYPASEDITQAGKSNGKKPIGKPNDNPHFNDTVDNDDAETSFKPGTDADITGEDLMILDAAGNNMSTDDSANLMRSSLDSTDDDGDLLNETSSLGMSTSGDDLDVPGSEADDANEELGEEDEENNYYSLGGDNHESQEENKGD